MYSSDSLIGFRKLNNNNTIEHSKKTDDGIMETKRFLYLHSVKTFSDNLSVRVVTIRNVKIIPDFNFIAGLKLRIPQSLKQEDTYVDFPI